jgi:hypothetical protein
LTNGHDDDNVKNVIDVGRSAWRLDKAERLAFLVDGEACRFRRPRPNSGAPGYVSDAGDAYLDRENLDAGL